MPQISASVKENTITVIKEIAKEENHTFSNMINIILTNTAAQWIVNKSKKPNGQPKKISKSKNK